MVQAQRVAQRVGDSRDIYNYRLRIQHCIPVLLLPEQFPTIVSQNICSAIPTFFTSTARCACSTVSTFFTNPVVSTIHLSQHPLYNAPPQYAYPPLQHISPTVQCPSCASRFAPFVIQYDPAVTAWHAGPPVASPATSPNATMPPSIQSQARSMAPSRNINFDSYTTKVRKVYDKYSSSSGGTEYKNAGSAIKEIEAIVTTIKGQVPHVSFARKQDALDAIVDISLMMLESTRSTLAHETRKSYQFPALGDAIERIIDRLSRDELYILQEDGNLVNELEQCKEAAEDYALGMCLDGAIEKLLNGLSDEEYEEDSGYDGVQGDGAGGSALHLLVEKTTAATPWVGGWLESLEPTAAPLMVAAAV